MYKSLMHTAAIAALLIGGGAQAASDADIAKTKEILGTAVSFETSKGLGNVPKLAAYLADELKKGGFTDEDITIIPMGETAGMIVRYKGDGSSGKKGIGFAAHMDVVDADPKDWERSPFTMVEEDGYLFGRGVLDCKFGVSTLVATFLKLKAEGFVPTRDLVLVFTGDEESGMETTKALSYDYHDKIDIEYILNSDAGGAALAPDGTPVAYAIQAAEKTYASFEMTVTNPGGHSSRPRKDNAIYDLATALKKIEAFEFPAEVNEITTRYFATLGPIVGGEAGAAMTAFAKNPKDKKALGVLRSSPEYVGTTGTTCIATMLKGGHAENALPQAATATINCRIFPGTKAEETLATLKKVAGNDAIQWKLLGDGTASPASPLRDDVVDAITASVHAAYPGLTILPQMESGGTDGKHYRASGWPTYGVSGIYMKMSDMFAHGLNERLPAATIPLALDHWHHLMTDLGSKK
ncbi:M20/M25/M40 family metallo-hydrolase [Gimibacter soli]|uniref:M20/M25/M40 family metallo-hydrolase n=1 Tax=Gimibacter soli TaxID=3024400 RepID=A0AAE9XU70_9PROT|nr:M20/M25/M40 family metallo-hydrolase [Gimibacter soli]WCL55026.1 M20/M25/M40 family metallo-hydrolase [Gimibacter soli]